MADRHPLDIVREVSPDVILLDIPVERSDPALTVLQMLRLDPATRAIPVVVCIPHLLSSPAHDILLKARCCAVLIKPFKIEELQRALTAAALAADRTPDRAADIEAPGELARPRLIVGRPRGGTPN